MNSTAWPILSPFIESRTHEGNIVSDELQFSEPSPVNFEKFILQRCQNGELECINLQGIINKEGDEEPRSVTTLTSSGRSYTTFNRKLTYLILDRDLVTFTLYRIDQQFVKHIINKQQKENRSLECVRLINQLILEENWIPLMGLVWAADDQKRVEWLRENVSKLPAPFFYEYAYAEILTSEEYEIVERSISVVLPIIEEANFMVYNDGMCIKPREHSLEGLILMDKIKVALLETYLSFIREKMMSGVATEEQFARYRWRYKNSRIINRAMPYFTGNFLPSPRPDYLFFHSGRSLEIKTKAEDFFYPSERCLLRRKNHACITLKKITSNSPLSSALEEIYFEQI
jgi:hypothetical protein